MSSIKHRDRNKETDNLIMVVCARRWDKTYDADTWVDLLEQAMQSAEDHATEKLPPNSFYVTCPDCSAKVSISMELPIVIER